jgi:hypothetical protein
LYEIEREQERIQAGSLIVYFDSDVI